MAFDSDKPNTECGGFVIPVVRIDVFCKNVKYWPYLLYFDNGNLEYTFNEYNLHTIK